MDSGSGTTGGGPGRPPCWRTLKESCKGLGSVSLKINNQHTHGLGFTCRYADLPLTLLGVPVSIGADPGHGLPEQGPRTETCRVVGPPFRDRTACARSA